MDYYVFPTQVSAQGCIDYINSTPWFPITGKINGVPAPESQKTTSWCNEPSIMISGEFAVPRIPTNILDSLGVTQEDRDAFIAAFGQDIRDLDNTAFPTIEEE